MRNLFLDIRKEKPNLWAVGMFVPMLFITVAVLPLGLLIDFLTDCPQILQNLWLDISEPLVENAKQGWQTIARAWRNWYQSLIGKGDLQKQMGKYL